MFLNIIVHMRGIKELMPKEKHKIRKSIRDNEEILDWALSIDFVEHSPPRQR